MMHHDITTSTVAEHNVVAHSRKRIFVYITFVAVVCLLLFVLADYLQGKLPSTAPFWEAIKTLAPALFPATVVAIIDHFRTIGEVADRMASQISREVTEKLVAGREQYGFVGFLREMDFVSLFKHLRENDELWWLDACCPNDWSFLAEFEKAILRDATIHILMCDNASFRSEELHNANFFPNYFQDEGGSCIASIIGVAQKAASNPLCKGSCEIRMYEDLPRTPCRVLCNEKPSQTTRLKTIIQA